VVGSGVTLLAAKNMNRRAYGFEIKKQLCGQAGELILNNGRPYLLCDWTDKRTQNHTVNNTSQAEEAL
jgi:DNA modification methylase